MNREGGNKYENYWGNIIVNYLDNKRMNYVGYINNNDKKKVNENEINYEYHKNWIIQTNIYMMFQREMKQLQKLDLIDIINGIAIIIEIE